jgi:hypothetical protein
MIPDYVRLVNPVHFCLTLTMGRTLRCHPLMGCRHHLPMHQASSCSHSIHLSHAEVGFCHFLQNLFAVTCHSSWSVMQAILLVFALSLYFTDNNNDVNNEGQVTQALLLLAMGRYSVQVICLWRVFYLIFLYHDIPLEEEESQRLHDFPWKNICFNAWTSQEKNSSLGSITNLVLRSWQPQTTDISVCLQGFKTTTFILRSFVSL